MYVNWGSCCSIIEDCWWLKSIIDMMLFWVCMFYCEAYVWGIAKYLLYWVDY
jgi:hypothetical protein